MATYLEKSCPFGLPRVPFVNCRQFMYLVISLLVWGQDVGSDCISSWSLLIFLHLNEVAARYGYPLTILSDQKGAFESAIIRDPLQIAGLKTTRTSPRTPRCNGQAERFNRSLLRMIKAYLQGEQTDWDLNLDCLVFVYRASPSESTHLTANLLFLGREVRCNKWISQLRGICKAPTVKNSTCSWGR